MFKEILGSDSWPDFRGLAAVGWADVSQERAELILLRRARELGAQIRFGTELVSCTQDADGVTTELRDPTTGETSSVRADYLVAADGQRRPYSDVLADQQYVAYISRMAPHRADGTEAAPVSPVSALYFGYRHLSEAVAIEPDDDGALLENPERPTGRPGTRAPHVRLRDNGTELSTRDLFGRHLVLLAGAAGSDWPAVAEKAEQALGIRCAGFLIGGATGAVDLDEAFGARYGISPGGAVLVRPDGFIAWRAMADGSPAELETALRRILDRNGDLADGGRRRIDRRLLPGWRADPLVTPQPAARPPKPPRRWAPAT